MLGMEPQNINKHATICLTDLQRHRAEPWHSWRVMAQLVCQACIKCYQLGSCCNWFLFLLQGIELTNPLLQAQQEDAQRSGTESYFSEYSGFRSIKGKWSCLQCKQHETSSHCFLQLIVNPGFTVYRPWQWQLYQWLSSCKQHNVYVGSYTRRCTYHFRKPYRLCVLIRMFVHFKDRVLVSCVVCIMTWLRLYTLPFSLPLQNRKPLEFWASLWATGYIDGYIYFAYIYLYRWIYLLCRM